MIPAGLECMFARGTDLNILVPETKELEEISERRIVSKDSSINQYPCPKSIRIDNKDSSINQYPV